MMKLWLFSFAWKGPTCPILSARVLAETEDAAWYILAADPRLEKVDVTTKGAKCNYAGDMQFFKPGVEEIVYRKTEAA
jgi:uncharacterized protein (DUF427 family)